MPTCQLIEGDVLRVLATGREESVQCVVTSPPYWGLRDYRVEGQLGLEDTPDEYVSRMVKVFQQVHRLLAPDGTLWLNIGDSYAGSWGAQSRPNGTDIKSSLGGGSMLSARQIEAHPRGTHMGSVKNTPGIKPKDLVGIPWLVAFALRADGWYLRSDIIWHKPNPMPESVTDRPTKAHEYLFLLTKSERYYFNNAAIAEPLTRPEEADRKTPARFGGADKWKEAKKQSRLHSGNEYKGTPTGTRNKRTVWTVATQSYRGAHFATFPERLIEPCILAGSCPGDIVLDPFCGSGTAGVVALRHGRSFAGIDLNPAYLDLARKRIGEPWYGDEQVLANVSASAGASASAAD